MTIADDLDPSGVALLAELQQAAAGRTGYSEDDLRLADALLIEWTLQVADPNATLDGLLDTRNIERFIRTGLPQYTPASRGNIRSRLLRVAELVADPRGLRPQLAALPSANALRPYREW